MNHTTAQRAMVDAALQMAVKGWAVIPWHDTSSGQCSCRKKERCSSPGKHPRLPKWTEKGSRDPDQIVKWWKQWPNANVGIVTGTPSDVFILDFDVRSGGRETLIELMNDFPQIRETFRVRTGGGGWHLYFQNPKGGVKSNAGVLPGMDVRGEGGGVVSPGSIHITGNVYTVQQDAPVLQCPDGLLARVSGWTQERHKNNSGATQESRTQESAKPKGQRKTQVSFESLSAEQQGRIDRVIKLSIPTREGTRNKNAFTFARRLQSVSGFGPDTDPETLREICKRFHEAMMAAAQENGIQIRGAFVDTFNDVRYAWPRIHTPADEVMSGVIEKVAEAFSSGELPDDVVDCLDYLGYADDHDTALLMTLCWQLDQLWKGAGFYLSCRSGESALKQLGASESANFQWVSRRLIQLQRDAVIVCTKPSEPGQRNIASEYKWTWAISSTDCTPSRDTASGSGL